MELIKFLNTASDAELLAAVMEWVGYGVVLVIVLLLAVLLLNAGRWQRTN